MSVSSLVIRQFPAATAARLGGPAHTLRLFKTQRHAYLFSGIVHLGDLKLLNFSFLKTMSSWYRKTLVKSASFVKLVFLALFFGTKMTFFQKRKIDQF